MALGLASSRDQGRQEVRLDRSLDFGGRMLTRMLSVSVAAVMAGCGGGGGGGGETKTLLIALSYPDANANLWQPANLDPRIIGLEGNSPTCQSVAGRLPAGLSLQSDCRIVGTPQEQGSFSATVRITVRGFEGQVDTPISVSVAGPSAEYGFNFNPTLLTVGQQVTQLPGRVAANGQRVNWMPQAGQSMAYSVTTGSLPAGLSLDADTGAITGVVQATGRADFTVTVLARSADGGTVSNTGSYGISASLPDITVSYDPKRITPYAVGDTVSAIPMLRFGSGVLAADYQFAYASSAITGALPAGLTLDPNTGEIGGTLTGPVDSPDGLPVDYVHGVTVTATVRNTQFTLNSGWAISVTPPPLAPGAGFRPAPATLAGPSAAWRRLYAPLAQFQFANTMEVYETLQSVRAPIALDDSTNFSFVGANGAFSSINIAPERVGQPLVRNSATTSTPPPLAPGLYVGTVPDSARRLAAPTLNAGCTGSGAFKIHEITLEADGRPSRLAMDYVQSCKSFGTSTVMGAIRHNSSVPAALDELYAVAGRNGDVLEGTALVLDGSASWSPVSPVIERRWRQLSGPTFDLDDCQPQNAMCATYAPTVGSAGATAVFELQVTSLAGRTATTQLTLRIRSTAERQSLVQLRDATGRTRTTTGSDLRFDVPTQFGSQSIYLLQQADRFYVQAFGNRPEHTGTVDLANIAFSTPNGQPFAVPQSFSGTGPAFSSVFGQEFDTGLPGIPCDTAQWQLALPALTRDTGDFTSVQRLSAWFGVACPTGEPMFSRFWIDHQPVTPPTARATGPASSPRGSAFTLTDAGSTLPLGPLKGRYWTQVAGPAPKSIAVLTDGALQVTPADNVPDGARMVFSLEVVDALGQPAVALVRTVVSGGPAPQRVDARWRARTQ